MMGRAKPVQGKLFYDGFRLEQRGVFMDVMSDSGWLPEQRVADQSACWKRVLEDGSYPYAGFPLVKLVFHMPAVDVGQTYVLGTLLAATRFEAQYAIQSEPGRIRIDGPHVQHQGLRAEDRDLAVRIEAGKCEVSFATVPEIPRQLADWSRERAPKGEGKHGP